MTAEASSSDVVARGALRTISNGPQIFSLDIADYDSDEEVDSLVVETADGVLPLGGKGRLADLRKRNSNQSSKKNGARTGARVGTMLGLVRSGLRDALFSGSHVRLLAILAFGSMMFVLLWTNRLSEMDVVETHKKSPHSPSLGGANNGAHYSLPGDTSLADDDTLFATLANKMETEDVDAEVNDDDVKHNSIPIQRSIVGKRVNTKNKENGLAYQSHYRHDPLKSVYSSPLYANNTNTEIIQQEFLDKMKAVAETYGQWDPPERDADDFQLNAPLKDYEAGFLQDLGTWQSDSPYVKAFLNQSKLLVARVKEGIYATYGLAKSNATDSEARRLTEFQVIVGDEIETIKGAAIDKTTRKPALGIAYLNKAAWNALVRKLLHGMLAMDNWYVVAVGNANTYAGNNFQQSAVMEFNDIMEPVFDKLGMNLIARNMGINASTAVMALGGADLWGEADILWHIPDNRETVAAESPGMADLLYRQAILSGERLPIILTPSLPVPILKATNYTTWFGNIQPGANFCEETQLLNGKLSVSAIKACRFVRCSDIVDCNKRNSVCWIPRSDFSPAQPQDRDVGYQKEGYPNFRQQKLDGSKLAMLILHALEEALKLWEEQTLLDKIPLPNDLWHVGKVYSSIREKVRTLGWGSCDQFMRRVHPSICHMQMHAYTEWTPLVDSKKRIKSLLKLNNSVTDVSSSAIEAYDKIDLWPKEWKLENAEVDVHLIAVASDTQSLTPGTMPFGEGAEDYEDTPVDEENGGRDVVRRHRRVHESSRMRAAKVSDDEKTWTVINAPIGFCDGSSNSHCNRIASNNCFLANFNHYRAGLLAHGQSGNLSLSIPRVQEGIVLARFEWELENGPRVKDLPQDFKFIMTVNGNTTSMTRSQFAHHSIDVHRDLRVFTLLLDDGINDRSTTSAKSRQVDIDLEVTSTSSGLRPLILLTHIYYA